MLAGAAPLIPDAERAAFDALRAEVAALDAAEGPPEGSPTRILSWRTSSRRRAVRAVLRGYREHVTLEAEELDRLGAVARSRPLILRAWSVCMGQTTPTEAMTAASETEALTEMIATRIRAAVTGR